MKIFHPVFAEHDTHDSSYYRGGEGELPDVTAPDQDGGSVLWARTVTSESDNVRVSIGGVEIGRFHSISYSDYNDHLADAAIYAMRNTTNV
jgi:hypothetical protein